MAQSLMAEWEQWRGHLVVSGAVTLALLVGVAVAMVACRRRFSVPDLVQGEVAPWLPGPAQPTRREWLRAMWPAAVLGLLALLVLGCLKAIGYVGSEDGGDLEELACAVARPDPGSVAAQRGLMAYRGVTLALAVAFTLLAMWLLAGAWARGGRYFRNRIVGTSAVSTLVFAAVTADMNLSSPTGANLLHATWLRLGQPWQSDVAMAIFMVGVMAPATLACAACLMLEPLPDPFAAPYPSAIALAREVERRRRGLEQVLYTGAACLVFGTLSVSATLALAGVGLPTPAEVASKADVCRTLAGQRATEAAGPSASAVRGAASPIVLYERLELAECASLPEDAYRAAIGRDVRDFARNLTLSFGVGFSALLVAIYVPATLVLRDLSAISRHALERSGVSTRDVSPATGADDDDLVKRLAAVAATLSPLFAGLVSNALGAS